MSHPYVSLVICTFNRCQRLEATLASVVELDIAPDLRWELVLVDNNSTDRTRETAERFSDRLPLRYVFEPRQGKTFALNRALGETHGELLLFTDDDVRLERAWLSEYVRASRQYPQAGWFGGKICPWWPTGRPSWLKDDGFDILRGYFVAYDVGLKERWYEADDPAPFGANMGVPRSTFDMIGQYREDVGPRGTERGVSDDTELIQRASQSGLRGLYLPSAVCEHYVSEGRLGYADFFRYGLIKGEQQSRVAQSIRPMGARWRACLFAVRAACQFAKGRRDRARAALMNCGLELGSYRGAKGVENTNVSAQTATD